MVKVKKKYSKYFVFFLAAVILTAGFRAYKSYDLKQLVIEDKMDAFEEKIPLSCENGEWVIFPDLKNSEKYQKFAGNTKLSYSNDGEKFSSEDKSRSFVTDENYSLSFFADRDVRVEGYETGENETYVQKIKCVGVEANKDIQNQRRNLMNYISKNINSLALEKSEESQWQVETFYFINENDLYVQYESEKSFMEESPYDSHLWLIRATKLERNIPVIETLAYIQENFDDPDKNIVKQGEDLYKDVKNMTIYEFDDDAGQWILQ